MEKHFIQTFEYENNKHFNSVPVINNFKEADNIEILELINSLDSIINYVITVKPPDPKQFFLSSAKKYSDRLLEIFDQRSKKDAELNSTLLTIHRESLALAERFIENLTANEDFVPIIESKTSEKFLQDLSFLKQNGYVEYEFPRTPEFNVWCESQLENARKKYENESDWRGANSYEKESFDYKFIEAFIQKNRILEIISEYKQMNMALFYAAWDYSHSRQKWFRFNHEYNHISPTNYYHYDADEDVSKLLIYLTDVTEKDGPFKFVKESNTMPRSPFLVFIHYAIDFHISRKYAKPENLYGRGLFLYRKDLVMKLPSSIRGTTHFGDDLIENSALADHMLGKTTTFLRKKGAAILFDGYRGVHAGSNAEDGERLAVQVAFRRKKYVRPAIITATPTVKQRIKNKIKSLLQS